MLFFHRPGIVNVKMIITEEKILSNIDKVQKMINPNSKKQIVQLEDDAYFKDLVDNVFEGIEDSGFNIGENNDYVKSLSIGYGLNKEDAKKLYGLMKQLREEKQTQKPQQFQKINK